MTRFGHELTLFRRKLARAWLVLTFGFVTPGAARLFIVFCFIGVAFLVLIVGVLAMGPLAQMETAEKLSLMEVLVSSVGFVLALFLGSFALHEFRPSIQRPELRLRPLTFPTVGSPGTIRWAMQWNVCNEGALACNWFSIEIILGVGLAGSNVQVDSEDWPIDPLVGGKWQGTPHPNLPAKYVYRSNGEVGVFDPHGVDMRGPAFQVSVPMDEQFQVWAIIRGAGAPAHLYQIWVAPDGTVPKQSEQAMTRHPLGARL